MARVFDRVGMATATTGTGTITLGSAVSNFGDGAPGRTFSGAGVSNGDKLSYLIIDGAAWELGTGAYSTTGPALTRTLSSSSTGALLNLSGSAKVYSVAMAADVASGPLTTYTPTVAGSTNGAAVTGTFQGWYARLGSLVFVRIYMLISSIGTATGTSQVSLPFVASGLSLQMIPGRENGATGQMLQGLIAPGGSVMSVFEDDNGVMLTNGYSMVLQGWYEAAAYG